MAVAEVLDLPGGERVDDGSVAAARRLLVERLRELPVDEAAAESRASIRALELVETEAVARKLSTGAADAEARRLAGAGGDRSKRDAEQVKRRAEAILENPALLDQAQAGSLSTGQLDAIAESVSRTDKDAASDPDLIDRVRCTQNPDQARRAAKAWEDARADQAEIDREARRHWLKRGVSRFVTKRGTSALMFEGDKHAIDQMENAVAHRADELYKADGGRDVPAHKHPRTENQRWFDAAHELIASGTLDTDTNEPPDTDNAGDSGPSAPARPSGPAGRRAAIHLAATVDSLFGDAVDPAVLIGSGPLPTPELERFGCFADLVGTIFSGDGEILWQGRRVRTVTPAQWDALVLRDRGCVLCGAKPQRCEAHHLMPANAPVRGPTDIDNLALVCAGCHRHIHNTSLALQRTRDGWRTRPATPDERAPKRGPTPRAP